MARLLLVDDEPDIREAMTQIVQALLPDLDVVTAANGQQALDILRHGHVDLVLTDYKMPGMDGAHLVQEIRKSWPGLPVRMFTAFMDAGMLAEVHARVPDLKIIPKPLDVEFLVAQLREALAER